MYKTVKNVKKGKISLKFHRNVLLFAINVFIIKLLKLPQRAVSAKKHNARRVNE